MPKVMTIVGLVVSGLIALVFLVDLALGLPFNRASTTMDISFLICAVLLAYMSWTTMKEQV
ncbi:MAG: hypothetical protein KDA42_03905 [Planctomycetales bacterium]|nr:hypothetical protein [Planctomycetales bacterium]